MDSLKYPNLIGKCARRLCGAAVDLPHLTAVMFVIMEVLSFVFQINEVCVGSVWSSVMGIGRTLVLICRRALRVLEFPSCYCAQVPSIAFPAIYIFRLQNFG